MLQVRTPLAPADFSFCSRLLQHALVFDDEPQSSDSGAARKLAASLSKATYVASSHGQAEHNAELTLTLTLTLAPTLTLTLTLTLALTLTLTLTPTLTLTLTLAPTQAERNAELAHHMMALFEANRFRGHMDGLARSHKLALLTKLAGGFRAWQAPRKRLKGRELSARSLLQSAAVAVVGEAEQ